MTSEIQQHGSERRQISGLWVFPDRARRPFHCMIELLRIEAHQSHQMQQLGMLGTGFQGFMTAKLGVEMPSGPHVAENGLAKSGLHSQREHLHVGFRLLAGGPTLATAHLRIPIPALPLRDSSCCQNQSLKLVARRSCSRAASACWERQWN